VEGDRNRELPEAMAEVKGRRGKVSSCVEEQDVGAALLQSQSRKATPLPQATNTPSWSSRAPSHARHPLLTVREAPRVLTSIHRPEAHRSRAEDESAATVSMPAVRSVRAWHTQDTRVTACWAQWAAEALTCWTLSNGRVGHAGVRGDDGKVKRVETN
jgi:hypothetical protein